MTLAAELAKERRARLAAERLLQLRQRELQEANAQLGRHANALTEEIVERREEAEELRDQTHDALAKLQRATHEVDIAKKRLWQSIETIEDGFAVFDSDSRLVIANSAYLAAFENMEAVKPGIGYGDLIQLAVEEGIVDIGDEAPDRWCSSVLKRWAQPQPQPMVLRLWNGVSIKLVDQRSSSGDTTSLALNITDTIRHESKLRRARDQANSANRAKSAFLARMSHELRTPMNGVVAMAELLSETELDVEQVQFVDTIRSSAEALLVLINDVLDFSKLEAKKLTLLPESFNLERLITDVGRLFLPTAQAKGIELVLDYDVNLPTVVMADHGRIRQILNNLIGNAIKFTESGNVIVRTFGCQENEEGQFEITLTVTDTGIGIQPEQIEHIFGEFNQVDDQRNRRFEGTGLGLAITRQLLDLMGGRMWVESTPGTGSTFGFTLRLAAPSGVDTITGKARLAGCRVVLLSDRVSALTTIAAQLRALGANCTEVPAITGALIGELNSGDVVVLDLDKAPALQAIEDLRQRKARLRLIGYTSGGHKAAAELNGVVLLTKPANIVDLLDVLAQEPIAVEPSLARTGESEEGRPDHEEGISARRMKVLAAEDNATNRLVLEKMLARLNIELRFAENGRLAVESWRASAPDLVFMDISMPEMDGKEATQAIRKIEQEQDRPRTPIVALTAHAVEGDAEEILKAGLDHYLTKPLKKDALLAQVRAAVPPGVEAVFAEADPTEKLPEGPLPGAVLAPDGSGWKGLAASDR